MKKILLVEDEPLLIELYRDAFEEEPFELVVAETGRDGLQKAKDQPDLILLDILLPELNGFEVLRQLKSHGRTKNIPVIVLTNLGSEETDKDKQLSLSLGAVDYLVKSYHTPDEVVATVKRYVEPSPAKSSRASK